MTPIAFLSSVLGDDAYYCLLRLPGRNKGGKRQTFHTSLADLLDAAGRLDADGFNVYYAMATFPDTASREADAATRMRSLYIDIDCGPKKDYATQADALQALQTFCADVGMPRPTVVDSGRGLHVYWPLEEAVDVAEWLPVSRALKRAAVVHSLRIDPTATSDAARVLRVPGTHNYKDDPAREVRILGKTAGRPTAFGDLAGLLAEYVPAPEPRDLSAVLNPRGLSARDDPTMQRLVANRESVFKRIMQKSIAGRGCQQILNAASDQENTPEPVWRAALSIATHCSDRKKAIHAISNQHPQYDADETEDKAARIEGPYTCDTFAEFDPEVCAACPLRGKIKSPIVLGHQVVEAKEEDNAVVDPVAPVVHQIPKFPDPYIRGAAGGVYVRTTDEEGDLVDELVYVNDLYFTRRVHDAVDGESIVGRLHLPHDGVREVVVPLVSATSKEDLRKALAKSGVSTFGKGWDKIMAYTHSWLTHLQATTVSDESRRQFGWTDHKLDCFVIGDKEITADGIGYNPPSPATAAYFHALEQKGTLEGWIKQAEFYNREGLEAFQYMVLLSMASPLMALTPCHAAIFDFYSDKSGYGKTTTQKFALTVYGDPEELIINAADTLNHRVGRLEILKNITAQFDEFTEFPAHMVAGMLMETTAGRQKGRMSSGSNAERHRGRPWHLTVTLSSNESAMSKVRSCKALPDAEAMRVLSYQITAHNSAAKEETDEFARGVGDHRGFAGVEFVKYMLAHPQEVKALLESVQRKIDKKTGMQQKHRFWSVQVSVVMTALLIARDIGLVKYDAQRMMNWVVQLVKSNMLASAAQQISVETLITDYVSEHYGNILWIKSTDDLRTLNGNGLDNLVVPDQQPRGQLVARYETDLKRLFLLPKPLREWCHKNRLNYDSVVAEATKELNAERRKVRLSKGTKMNLPPADCLIMDCSSLDMPDSTDT